MLVQPSIVSSATSSIGAKSFTGRRCSRASTRLSSTRNCGTRSRPGLRSGELIAAEHGGVSMNLLIAAVSRGSGILECAALLRAASVWAALANRKLHWIESAPARHASQIAYQAVTAALRAPESQLGALVRCDDRHSFDDLTRRHESARHEQAPLVRCPNSLMSNRLKYYDHCKNDYLYR
jgi:hypothetical protein